MGDTVGCALGEALGEVLGVPVACGFDVAEASGVFVA